MKRIHSLPVFLMWIVSLITFTSCIHEYPEGEGVDPSVVLMDMMFTTNSDMEIYPLTKTEGESGGVYRFKVCVYENDFDGQLILEREIYVTPDVTGNGTAYLQEKLQARNYKVAVWVEWVSAVGEISPIYNSEKLQAITFKGNYVGDTERKICFSGTYDLDLSRYARQQFAEVSESYIVKMPLAKIQLVSTDLSDFISLKANRAIEKYIVRWDYVLYFPTGFNVLTQKPNEADLNIGFETLLEEYPDNPDKADMGMDYVFVNGTESQVTINLTVYDAEGNELNTYQGIEVPIKRGFKTIIEGKFLMLNKSTGIGINPDFDGEFNVVLP